MIMNQIYVISLFFYALTDGLITLTNISATTLNKLNAAVKQKKH